MKEWLRFRISVMKWSVLPDWLWFLVASPLLWWAFGADPSKKKWTWPLHPTPYVPRSMGDDFDPFNDGE